MSLLCPLIGQFTHATMQNADWSKIIMAGGALQFSNTLLISLNSSVRLRYYYGLLVFIIMCSFHKHHPKIHGHNSYTVIFLHQYLQFWDTIHRFVLTTFLLLHSLSPLGLHYLVKIKRHLQQKMKCN